MLLDFPVVSPHTCCEVTSLTDEPGLMVAHCSENPQNFTRISLSKPNHLPHFNISLFCHFVAACNTSAPESTSSWNMMAHKVRRENKLCLDFLR